jgi:hypothetical protein
VTPDAATRERLRTLLALVPRRQSRQAELPMRGDEVLRHFTEPADLLIVIA